MSSWVVEVAYAGTTLVLCRARDRWPFGLLDINNACSVKVKGYWMSFRAYIVLLFYHLIVVLMNVVFVGWLKVQDEMPVVGLELEKQRKISLFWMSSKLIGGVPSFVIDFAWSYAWIMEMNTKIFRSIILRKDLFAILGAKVESGLLCDARL